MLDLKLQDKIPYSEIRKRIKATDIIEHTLKLLLLVRQMETPVSPMKVAVHRRSLRLTH